MKKSVILALRSAFFTFVLALPTLVFAATTPSLGLSATYGVLSSTYTNTSVTTINGDVGFTTGPAVLPLGTHANYGTLAPYAAAGADQSTALSALALEPCTYTFPAGAIDLSVDVTHGPLGVYVPGVYCALGAMDIGGAMNLDGLGTYIFRATGALTSTVGANVTLTNALACDIFWTPTQAVTLAANTVFAGVVIDDAGITVGANTVWSGPALAFGGTVTTDTSTMSVPSCATPSVLPASFRVVKEVVNTSGGSAVAGDFNVHVKLSGTDVAGSPAVGVAAPGTLYSLAAGTYVVSEDVNASYSTSFSGDCDATGTVALLAGNDKTCTITNTDIPVTPPAPAPVVNSGTGGGQIILPIIIPPALAQVAPLSAPILLSDPATTTITVAATDLFVGLPDTGFPPQEEYLSWGFVIFSTALVCAFQTFLVMKRKYTKTLCSQKSR